MSSAKLCPFCCRDPDRVLAEDDFTVIYKDGLRIKLGVALIN